MAGHPGVMTGRPGATWDTSWQEHVTEPKFTSHQDSKGEKEEGLGSYCHTGYASHELRTSQQFQYSRQVALCLIFL